MGTKKRRRNFDREFKLEAVRLIVDGGHKVSEVARNLGISQNTLSNWKRQFLEDSRDAFPGKGRLKPFEEENRLLRRKLKVAEDERDILKKALAIFSQEPE